MGAPSRFPQVSHYLIPCTGVKADASLQCLTILLVGGNGLSRSSGNLRLGPFHSVTGHTYGRRMVQSLRNTFRTCWIKILVDHRIACLKQPSA